MGPSHLDGLCLMYIHTDISISTGATIKKFAAQVVKENFEILQRLYIATIVNF